MQDIKLQGENGKFRLRVSGLIIKNNKLLVHKTQKFRGYCLPGGHAEIGETTIEAIKREMQEELNIDIDIKEIFCINENIYNSKDIINQEINYYYKVESLDDLPDKSFVVKEIDKGVEKEHEFCWVEINKLKEENFKPEHIAKLLMKNPSSSNNILLSDNR